MNLSYKKIQSSLKKLRKGGKIPKNFRLNQKRSVLMNKLNKTTSSNIGSKKKQKVKKDDITLKMTLDTGINGFTFKRFETNTSTLRGLHSAILKAKRKENLDLAYTALFFKDIETGKLKREGITIDNEMVDNYKMFVKRIEAIIKGEVIGSDAKDMSKYSLVKNRFDIFITKILGKGDDAKLMMVCAGLHSKKNKKIPCWAKVMNHLKINVGQHNLTYFDNFLEFVIKKKLKYRIMSNSFSWADDDKTFREIIKRKKTLIEHKSKPLSLWKLEASDMAFNYLHTPANCDYTHTIVMDEINRHYDVFDGDMVLADIYISSKRQVWKKTKDGFELIRTTKEINKTNGHTSKKKFKYIFFDYETIVDFNTSSAMRDYSLSFFVADDAMLESLDKMDLSGNKKGIDELIKENVFNCVKFNSTDLLRDYVINNDKDTQFTFISYNGSNFDNFLMLDYLLKYPVDRFKVAKTDNSSIFYNGTQLFNFCVNGTHSTFDLAKHLTGSLKSNCASFKINCVGKKDFDHNIAQKLYEEGKLIETISKSDKLIEYNNYDVLSLGLLFWRYKKELMSMELTKEYGVKLTDNMTIGGIIYKIFDKHTKGKNYKFDDLTTKEYNDIQKYKVAGRVEMFNGVQEIFERIASLDVCSLYPYVLSILNVYYPYGAIKRTKKFKKGKIGFYYCDVDQSNLKKANLPNIYAEKTKSENVWDSDKKLEDYLLSTVMIKLLQDYKCKVTVKHGFYFKKQAKSCDMFGFLNEFMMKKNEQDSLKGTNEYNSALRETLKLLMNSISGKVIERLHLDSTEAVDIKQFNKIKDRKTTESIKTINVIGDRVFVSYTVTQESKINTQRPVFLGVLCYDYAKDYMYRQLYSIIGLDKLLYTDTDAGKFRYSDMELFRKYSDKTIVPHWKEVEKIDPRYKTHKIYSPNSKVFGSFENELSDNNYFSCVQKKAWCCYLDDQLIKFGFKGVSNNSLLLDGPIDIKDTRKLYNFYINNKDLLLASDYNPKTKLYMKSNVKKLFQTIINNKEAYVLCQSFNKSVKNSKHAKIDEVEKFNKTNNTIRLLHSVKNIVVAGHKKCKTCKTVQLKNTFVKTRCANCAK